MTEQNEDILTDDERDALISAYLDCKAIARNTGLTHHDMTPLVEAVEKIVTGRAADEPPALGAS